MAQQHNMFSNSPAPTLKQEIPTFIMLLVVGLLLTGAYFFFDQLVLILVGIFFLGYGVVRMIMASRNEKNATSA